MNINWFDTTYYSLLYKNRSESEAQLFIDNILNKINIKTKSKVLDLACGLGRHSKYLEKKGILIRECTSFRIIISFSFNVIFTSFFIIYAFNRHKNTIANDSYE